MKQVHEYAKIFPPLEGEDFAALCADIKAHGLLNPITLFEDQILDGRNREKACAKTGVKPIYENYKGKDAFAYVVSQNILRRHLTTSQRAVLALELEKRFAADMPKGKAATNRSAPIASVGKSSHTKAKDRTAAGMAAAAVHVRPDIVKQAKRVQKEAPHLLKDVQAGRLTVGEALRSNLERKAHARAIKERSDAVRKHLQKENRQVKAYLDACIAFRGSLRVAIDSAERFSPEALGFVVRRHSELRELMAELERKVKNAKAA